MQLAFFLDVHGCVFAQFAGSSQHECAQLLAIQTDCEVVMCVHNFWVLKTAVIRFEILYLRWSHAPPLA